MELVISGFTENLIILHILPVLVVIRIIGNIPFTLTVLLSTEVFFFLSACFTDCIVDGPKWTFIMFCTFKVD